jgi:hypothetical protein
MWHASACHPLVGPSLANYARVVETSRSLGYSAGPYALDVAFSSLRISISVTWYPEDSYRFRSTALAPKTLTPIKRRRAWRLAGRLEEGPAVALAPVFRVDLDVIDPGPARAAGRVLARPAQSASVLLVAKKRSARLGHLALAGERSQHASLRPGEAAALRVAQPPQASRRWGRAA